MQVLGCRVQVLGYKVQVLGCRVWGSECGVQDAGFGLQGADSGVHVLGCRRCRLMWDPVRLGLTFLPLPLTPQQLPPSPAASAPCPGRLCSPPAAPAPCQAWHSSHRRCTRPSAARSLGTSQAAWHRDPPRALPHSQLPAPVPRGCLWGKCPALPAAGSCLNAATARTWWVPGPARCWVGDGWSPRAGRDTVQPLQQDLPASQGGNSASSVPLLGTHSPMDTPRKAPAGSCHLLLMES